MIAWPAWALRFRILPPFHLILSSFLSFFSVLVQCYVYLIVVPHSALLSDIFSIPVSLLRLSHRDFDRFLILYPWTIIFLMIQFPLYILSCLVHRFKNLKSRFMKCRMRSYHSLFLAFLKFQPLFTQEKLFRFKNVCKVSE